MQEFITRACGDPSLDYKACETSMCRIERARLMKEAYIVSLIRQVNDIYDLIEFVDDDRNQKR